MNNRRSIRLTGYDYTSSGAYFVTMCTYKRQHLLSRIVDGQVFLSKFGKIVAREWTNSGNIRHELFVDEFVVMPDHIHGIEQGGRRWDTRPCW